APSPTPGTTARAPRARAGPDPRLLRLPASALDHMLNNGFPIAAHIMSGIYLGKENLQALVRQQEKMSALGRLSAGLAHELNNPAAAARRAAAQLREAGEQQQEAGPAPRPTAAPGSHHADPIPGERGRHHA